MIRRMATNGQDISRQLRAVLDRLNIATSRRPEHLQGRDPRLVAVSKTKPASMIIDAYASGQRHFGENYIQELVEKSCDEGILQKCADVKWHFIGHLQRNKLNRLTSVPGLYMVETVESQKMALALNNSWSKQSKGQLAVMVQVNTSGEEKKKGADPSQVVPLALYIHERCPCLCLAGLMTIGSVESSSSGGSNPDFQSLKECRKAVAIALGVGELGLELSMGMSQDFEHAVEAGSTSVRVGSSIFGARNYPPNQPDSASGALQGADGKATGASGDASSASATQKTVDATCREFDHLSVTS